MAMDDLPPLGQIQPQPASSTDEGSTTELASTSPVSKIQSQPSSNLTPASPSARASHAVNYPQSDDNLYSEQLSPASGMMSTGTRRSTRSSTRRPSYYTQDSSELSELDSDFDANHLQQLDSAMTGLDAEECKSKRHSHGAIMDDGASDSNAHSSGNKKVAKSHTRKRAATGVKTSKKKVKPENWTADHVLQDPKSPLVTGDLRLTLANPDAFASLKPGQKSALLKMLPNNQHVTINDDGSSVVDPNFLMYDPNFRNALARTQEDIAEGRNDPEWLSQAITAHEQRSEGHFDAFKENEVEEFWGMKQRIPNNTIAAHTSAFKFEHLFAKGVVRIGDSFVMDGTMRLENGETTVVQKEALVIGIGKSHYPDVAVPKGHALRVESGVESTVLAQVVGPEKIAIAMSTEDARFQDKRQNGWTVFRIFRDGEDVGRLWDLRQALGFAQVEGDYKATIFGLSQRTRRITALEREDGYIWLNPGNVLLRKIRSADVGKLHLNWVLPISAESRRRLDEIAPKGWTFVKCDPRIMSHDGIIVPDIGDRALKKPARLLEAVMQVLKNGSQAWPTAFGRQIAGEFGPGWSGGHAHLGSLALQYPRKTLGGKTMFFDGFLMRAGDREADSRISRVESQARKMMYEREPANHLPQIVTMQESAQLEELLRENVALRTQTPASLEAHIFRPYFPAAYDSAAVQRMPSALQSLKQAEESSALSHNGLCRYMDPSGGGQSLGPSLRLSAHSMEQEFSSDAGYDYSAHNGDEAIAYALQAELSCMRTNAQQQVDDIYSYGGMREVSSSFERPGSSGASHPYGLSSEDTLSLPSTGHAPATLGESSITYSLKNADALARPPAGRTPVALSESSTPCGLLSENVGSVKYASFPVCHDKSLISDYHDHESHGVNTTISDSVSVNIEGPSAVNHENSSDPTLPMKLIEPGDWIHPEPSLQFNALSQRWERNYPLLNNAMDKLVKATPQNCVTTHQPPYPTQYPLEVYVRPDLRYMTKIRFNKGILMAKSDLFIDTTGGLGKASP